MKMAPAKNPNENSDPPGIEALFAANESALIRYAVRLTQDAETAQDLVQEAFMKLHSQFENVRQPRSWLFRTVHNLALNHQRDKRKLLPMHNPADQLPALDPPDPDPWPDAQIERLEAIGQTRLFLAALDERSRELIRLKFEEGLSYKAMSDRTGLSVSNVGYILHHALKSLAVELEKSGISV